MDYKVKGYRVRLKQKLNEIYIGYNCNIFNVIIFFAKIVDTLS